MQQTMQAFKERQAATLKTLRELQEFLDRGAAFGVATDPTIRAKLDNAVRDAANGKLRVALVGGFSEGKTAIAAAWLERLDKSTMKISQQESSNAVTVYDAGDCELVDTPGLFGFKEEINAETGAVEQFKEMTRKFVSESHLVIYVMDPANPVKDSHRDELNWLFRTLGLLPRTVFVLSRFDAVADVGDEQEYQQELAIKRKNVRDRLRDLIALSDAEAETLAVVGVAADPFARGTEHWLADLENFRTLSRIGTLQEATTRKLADVGGADAVIEDARRSIVRDVLGKQLPQAVKNDAAISREVGQLEEMNGQLRKELIKAQGDVGGVRTRLRDFVKNFFVDLILQTRGLSQQTFVEFFERNIGADGIVLTSMLQSAFEKHLLSVQLELEKMSISIDTEINHFNDVVRKHGKQGVDHVIKSGMINRDSVLAARDGLVGAAKLIGVDLQKALKFKPHGAIKFAKGIEGALAVLGLALEAWEALEQHKREKAFREGIASLSDALDAQRKTLLALIDGDQFETQFFPEMIELRRKVNELHQSLVDGQRRREEFHHWREHGEAIDIAFRELEGR